MSEAAVRILGLTKSFSAFTLGPLDLTVPTGAIYGFIGPNGAGKTTTIDLIMGMGKKGSGTIEVFGLDHIKEEVEVKKRVGYVSPDLSFSAWGRIDKLMGFISGFYEDWDDDYCAELMYRLNLGMHDRISTLSFGQRTKLALVTALSHRPDLLLLDEPLAGLDAVSKEEVFTELLNVVQDEKRTVLISSHNLDDIERFTDHLGIINNGRLMLEGPTDELVNRFRMVDCITSMGAAPPHTLAIRVLQWGGDRLRMLIDLNQITQEKLQSYGLTDIVMSPVTLEELFIAMVREPTKT